jgi:hypothetical protein
MSVVFCFFVIAICDVINFVVFGEVLRRANPFVWPPVQSERLFHDRSAYPLTPL